MRFNEKLKSENPTGFLHSGTRLVWSMFYFSIQLFESCQLLIHMGTNSHNITLLSRSSVFQECLQGISRKLNCRQTAYSVSKAGHSKDRSSLRIGIYLCLKSKWDMVLFCTRGKVISKSAWSLCIHQKCYLSSFLDNGGTHEYLWWELLFTNILALPIPIPSVMDQILPSRILPQEALFRGLLQHAQMWHRAHLVLGGNAMAWKRSKKGPKIPLCVNMHTNYFC